MKKPGHETSNCSRQIRCQEAANEIPKSGAMVNFDELNAKQQDQAQALFKNSGSDDPRAYVYGLTTGGDILCYQLANRPVTSRRGKTQKRARPNNDH